MFLYSVRFALILYNLINHFSRRIDKTVGNIDTAHNARDLRDSRLTVKRCDRVNAKK